MRSLWTEDAGSFDGTHVRFSPSWSWPKPAQRPHPPVVMGGAGGPVTFRHVAEYCDGWMPIHGRRDIAATIPQLHAACEAAGRDPGTVELGVFGCPPDPKVIDDYAALGFTRCVLGVPPTGHDDALRALDRAAPLFEQHATG
jgi:hypothetical protein